MLSPKLLIIGSVWPEPNSSAAGSRMMQLIAAFHKANYQITFATAAADSEFSVDLASIGVNKAHIQLNSASFDTFVAQLKPQVVIFDRFMTEEQYGWRLSESCPEALQILDTEDLHCLRAARQNAWKAGKAFQISDLLTEEVAKREIASILRCDLSLVISAFELDLLQNWFKIEPSLLLYLPFMLEQLPADFAEKIPSFEHRKHFISIGNFLHQPNWQSVLHLKNKIWPLIRKRLPQAEIHIYGAYPSEKVFQLQQPKEGFIIKGRAENVNAVMQNARVCLAPLLFGAGLKGKLIDAMQNGTPNVTTAIGAEAMHGNLAWPGQIENDVEKFADAAVALYQNKDLWMQKQALAYPIINQIYSKTAGERALLNNIGKLLSTLQQHRQQNFLGAMLRHHQLNSTKYLSKWIEAKNKSQQLD
ncbi:glycosyltransferase [Pelobium manganitolerans]|uniref:glycosyltransferase n=1 Tax=Pelobium manganitolerans TaxID=1842495 RepID=UPI003FA38410